MPQLSSSNRSQLSYKLEGAYPTNWGAPQGGNGVLLNMLSESFNFDIKTLSSKAIRSDRQVPDVSLVSAMANGGFAFEHVYKEYDPFIEGVMQSTFTPFGTLGVTAALPAITSIVTASSITTITFASATSGNDLLTLLHKGQWIILEAPAAATQAVKDYMNRRALRVSLATAPTSTVLVLDASTPLDTAVVGATMAAGTIIGSSRIGPVALTGYNPVNVMKSYTVEVQHADIGQFRQYKGMIPSKMALKLAVGEIVTGSFDFMGKDFSLLQATSMGTPAASQAFTPANATKGVFDLFENGTSISAITYIKSAELNIDNTLRGQEAVGVFGYAGVGAGTMQITGKLEVYFAEATLYQRFQNGTASSLSIPVLDVDGNGYVYYFPKIRYTSGKVSVGGLDQDNMLSLDFQAVPDTLVGSPTFGQSVVIYRVGT